MISKVEPGSFKWVIGESTWLTMQGRELSDFVFACSRAGVIEVNSAIIQIEVCIDLKVSDEGISIFLIGRGMRKTVWATLTGGIQCEDRPTNRGYMNLPGTQEVDSAISRTQSRKIPARPNFGRSVLADRQQTTSDATKKEEEMQAEESMLGKRRQN